MLANMLLDALEFSNTYSDPANIEWGEGVTPSYIVSE